MTKKEIIAVGAIGAGGLLLWIFRKQLFGGLVTGLGAKIVGNPHHVTEWKPSATSEAETAAYDEFARQHPNATPEDWARFEQELQRGETGHTSAAYDPDVSDLENPPGPPPDDGRPSL